MDWTEEKVEELRALRRQGLSAAQVAARIGGVTRNAVIGKMRRMGLVSGPRLRNRPKANHPWKPPLTTSTKVPRVRLPAPVVAAPMLRLCKWPVSDPPAYAECGAPCEKTYCAEHAAIAYRPPEKRRR